MTLWESVWGQVKAEMPQPAARPKTWGGFLGATFAAFIVIAIWFPIRLIAELLKTIDFSEKPDHGREAQRPFPRSLCPVP